MKRFASCLALCWLFSSTVALAATGPLSETETALKADTPAEEPQEEAKSIEWYDDLLKAHLNADEVGRPVALYVRSELCDSCDKMLEETLVDPSVVESSSAFTWVLYEQNKHREELEPFNVFTFPSVLILGPKNENILRIEGFRPVRKFMADLADALGRYELFEKGEVWDTPRPRPSTLMPGLASDAMELPINEAGHGVTFVEGKLWVVQARNLFGFDADTLKWETSYPLPTNHIRDICTDGNLIYALPWGWTKGDPIFAIDPATGQTVTQVATERNKKQRHSSAQGIEWFMGELYVLADGGRIYAVDPVTGEIRISMKVDMPCYGLAWNGEHFVTVSKKGVHFLTPSGKLKRSVATNYPLGSVGYNDGTYYLFESEIRGFDREHRFVKIWPQETVLHKVKL